MTNNVNFYWDNATKACLGAFDAEMAPPNATPAAMPPENGRQIWDENAGAWAWPNGRPDLPPLTARQIRLALINADYFEQTEAAISSLTAASRVEWEYASQYRRDHPLIDELATVLNLTAEQVDTMWQAALLL